MYQDRNNQMSSPYPDKMKYIDMELIAHVDGHDPNIVCVVNNAMCANGADCVLLRAKRSLGLKEFPTPARVMPNNAPQTTFANDISLLTYNGLPSAPRLAEIYPETSRDILYKALADLWIDRLSYATGKIVAFDGIAITHPISTYPGASGGPLLDGKGNIIGNILLNFH